MDGEDLKLKALDNARDSVVFENTAQTVFKHLKELESRRDSVMSRWIWELLQNARDTAPQNQELRVILSHEPQCLVFRHNGNPFTDKEIAHLIYHGSTKLMSTGQVGQFGTGFLNTHLISKEINVRGQLESSHQFDFVLDRQGKDFKALNDAMQSSWSQFKDSLGSGESMKMGDFTTEYRYPLNETTNEVVVAGINELKKYAPYVLAFGQVFKSIEIQNSNDTVLITKGEEEQLQDTIYMVELLWKREDQEPKKHYVALARNEDLSIAFTLQRKDGSFIVNHDKSVPKIFIGFPLSGTDDFAFPAVINSESFQPLENREGIHLGTGDNEENRQNQYLITEACGMLLTLLDYATKNGWQKAHNMALLGEFRHKTWLKEDWFKQLISEQVVGPVRDKNVFTTLRNELITPRAAWIPTGCANTSDYELWDLTAKLKDAENKLPNRDDLEDWKNILKGWSAFLNQETVHLPEAFTLKKLANYVAELGSIQNLHDCLNDDVEPVDWLNRLHVFFYKEGFSSLFEELELLPNQQGFLKKQASLWWDCDISEKLKEIAETLGLVIRGELLHRNITLSVLRERLHSMTSKDVLSRAIQTLKELSDQDPQSVTVKKGSVELFSWIIKNEKFDYLEGFPVLTEAPSDSEYTILPLTKHFADQDSKPLAPSGSWPARAQPFLDLFPKRYVLSSEYFDSCPKTELWEKIEAQGYLRTTPLYTKMENIKDFLPDEPLPNIENKRHITGKTVEVSKIAFLREEDIGILNTVRKSKKKAILLIEFLLQFALENDTRCFERLESICECGSSHSYYHAEWLIPLKHNQWVPIGESKNANPTPEYLAGLLEKQDSLVKMLTEGNGAKLLEALGVSVADLSLRTIAKDEETRVSLIKSLADITEATGNDADKVRMLAEEIRDHPEVIAEIEEHKHKREKVVRNQSVGRLVELILKELLESRGLTVTRTGIGSDFEVEVENDFLEGNDEILLQVGGTKKTFLIEIKSTTENDVRMTVPQARTAVAEKKHFSLCAVSLPKTEVTKEVVLAGSHFTMDIGERIRPLWDEYLRIENTKQEAHVQQGGIKLEISESQTRFSIGRGIWELGMSFKDATDFFSRGN